MTEIYGTLGPACQSEETLTAMFRAGMTGMRLNLSHTSLADSRDMIENFQKAADACSVSPELLIDLQGPELRLGEMEPIKADPGQKLELPLAARILDALEPGDRVLIDDGKIEASVVSVGDRSAALHILRGGVIRSRKSLKISGKDVAGPALTAHDRANLADARKYGVTAVMEPFVTSPETLRELRAALDDADLADVRIFAKIENRQGVQALPALLPEADMIVIARGDLGNDMPLWALPAVQKDIAQACRLAQVPFMVVTQMLASMADAPVPTRAEVSDIFNAVADGAAAVMVTNETAVGHYPAEVIRYLAKTAAEAEKWTAAQASSAADR